MITATQEMRSDAASTHAPRWRITTSDGQDWTRRLLSGRIVRDGDQAPRSRLALTLATEGAPVLIDQGLLPTGRDVYADYWHYPVEQYVRVFTGRLINSALTRTDSLWTLDAIDHSGTVQVDLISPGGITVPPTVAELVTELVHRTLPQAVVHISGPALTAPVPADLTIDGDPWQIIETAVQSCGSEAYFDADGDCIVRPEPSIGDPVDALRTGPQGVVTAYETAHEAAYSRVELLYKQGTGDTEERRTGVWEDHRADSPTSVERIGRVTLRQTDGTGFWPDQAQADQAAAALAARSAGRGRQTTLHHIPRPWIEPGDTVEVTLAGGPTELQLVASVDIPLQPDAQATKLRNDTYSITAEART